MTTKALGTTSTCLSDDLGFVAAVAWRVQKSGRKKAVEEILG